MVPTGCSRARRPPRTGSLRSPMSRRARRANGSGSASCCGPSPRPRTRSPRAGSRTRRSERSPGSSPPRTKSSCWRSPSEPRPRNSVGNSPGGCTAPNRLTEIAEHQRRRRSVRWRCDPDGMVRSRSRLEPLVAARLIAALSTRVMRNRPHQYPDGWPHRRPAVRRRARRSVTNGSGRAVTELVLHLRGDGVTLDDGTPIAGFGRRTASHPTSFLRALIHDAEGRRSTHPACHRHPTQRQKRMVKERDQAAASTAAAASSSSTTTSPTTRLSHRTVVDELELRCPRATSVDTQPADGSGTPDEPDPRLWSVCRARTQRSGDVASAQGGATGGRLTSSRSSCPT